MIEREIPSRLYAWRFPYWKRPIVRQFFESTTVVFIQNVDSVKPGNTLILWGSQPIPPDLANNVQILRLEDGFLRSVGLGADLIRPLSWAIDSQGLYYDATRPSDLELILQKTSFDPQLIARAKQFRKRVVDYGLTKYNVGHIDWHRSLRQQRVILVPGQVESDASIAFGASQIRTNIGLLKAVRQANPGAWIVYKPHPDVVAGLRAKGNHEDDAIQYCSEYVTNVTMDSLLNQVDEVHVLTSLTGFEALLREKSVTCYGQPFYAGWGLTTDIAPINRRTRLLHLDELVAGALLLYPTYVSWVHKKKVTAEFALGELLAWKEHVGDSLNWWRYLYRIYLQRIIGVR